LQWNKKKYKRQIFQIQIKENYMFVKTANDKNASSVIKSSGFTMLKLEAQWCNPCRALSPTVEKVAEERQSTLSIFKLDIDDSPTTAQALKVMGVPTMVLFNNGKEVSRKSGNMAKGALDAWLNSELEKIGG
jgi:thioredoxin 1